MAVIYKYLKDFYQEEFRISYLLVVSLLLGLLLYFNYVQGSETWLSLFRKPGLAGFWGYYFLYLIPFASAFFLQLLFFRSCGYYRKVWFWVILFLAPAFFSFRLNFNFHQVLINSLWNGDARKFWLYSLGWVTGAIVLTVLVLITWWIKDKEHQPFYGVKGLRHIRPYFIMLLLMTPVIIIAGTQKDFSLFYPRVKALIPLSLTAKNWHYLLYEICYGTDFVSIEFFFRGFLILSLAKICGPKCIIPAACFYCTIHLGKPVGEVISSFAGGVFLGIISYNTKSIWGGVLVHLGIAWFMEAWCWFL